MLVLQRLLLIVFFCFLWPDLLLAAESYELEQFFREIVLTGRTRARTEMTISSEVSGMCEKVLVDKGDILLQPNVLALLEPTFIKLEIEKNTILQRQAVRRLELKNRTVERFTTLTARQSAPVSSLEEVTLEADIDRLALQNLKNEEQRLQQLYRRHTLHGPAGWQVMEKMVEAGEYINRGQPLFRLGDFRTFLVTFQLSQEELQLLENMEYVELYINELDTVEEGKVLRIEPGFDETSQKVSVDFLLDPGDSEKSGTLRSGMQAQLTLKKEEKGLYVISRKALLDRYDSYWLLPPSKMKRRVILISSKSQGQEAVISGEGLRVGQSYLAPSAAEDRQRTLTQP